jgi:hypothetical protein
MNWVYFLKAKLETFEKFKVFLRQAENETKEKIGTLRTDNGGEFTSNEFQTFCGEKGIKRQFTNAYTPQQNRVIERMNRTLLKMAQSMLTFKNSSPSYSTEAVHTVIYLRNQSPTASLDGITPYEAWFGFKPRIKHLQVFGSVCYALIPKEKRTKLDSRSVKCILLGYSDEKGYCLLTNGKFIVSRDVIFDETKSKRVVEIESLLERLDKQVTKEKNRMHTQPSQQLWFEIDWILQNMTILHQVYLLLHHKVHLNLHQVVH